MQHMPSNGILRLVQMPPRPRSSEQDRKSKSKSNRRRHRHRRRTNPFNHPSAPALSNVPQSAQMQSQPPSLSSTNHQPVFQQMFHVPFGTIVPGYSTPYANMEPPRPPLITDAKTIPTYHMFNPQLIPSQPPSNAPVEIWPKQSAEWLIQQLVAPIQQSQPLWIMNPQAQAPVQLPYATMLVQLPQATPVQMQVLQGQMPFQQPMRPIQEQAETPFLQRHVVCAHCRCLITTPCKYPENECGYGRRCGFLHESCECEAPYCIKDHKNQKKYCAECHMADKCVGLSPKYR
uniref:C3H1-type domain-containing protein n=1 Tax=Panagrellus redivivus TaxID=6233 RepID=A0A7E4ZQT8_PANRE